MYSLCAYTIRLYVELNTLAIAGLATAQCTRVVDGHSRGLLAAFAKHKHLFLQRLPYRRVINGSGGRLWRSAEHLKDSKDVEAALTSRQSFRFRLIVQYSSLFFF